MSTLNAWLGPEHVLPVFRSVDPFALTDGLGIMSL